MSWLLVRPAGIELYGNKTVMYVKVINYLILPPNVSVCVCVCVCVCGGGGGGV